MRLREAQEAIQKVNCLRWELVHPKQSFINTECISLASGDFDVEETSLLLINEQLEHSLTYHLLNGLFVVSCKRFLEINPSLEL